MRRGRTGWGQNLASTRCLEVTTPWLFCSVTMGLAELQLLLKNRIQIYGKISEMNPSEILLLGSAVTLMPVLQMHIGHWRHDLFCKHYMTWLLSLEMPLLCACRCFSWRVTHIQLFQVALSFHSWEDSKQRLYNKYCSVFHWYFTFSVINCSNKS